MARGRRDDRRRGRSAPLVAKPDVGMSGTISAALLLSIALIVVPGSPRRRIAPAAPVRRQVPPMGVNGVGWIVACTGVAAALVLPLTTVLAVAVLGATAGLRYRRRRVIRR